jgi:uncharacterized CHY-type Zn-finger protein
MTVCEACHRKLHLDSVKGVKPEPLQSSGFFCGNCDRFYSVEYGRSHSLVCGVCGNYMVPWFTEKRD